MRSGAAIFVVSAAVLCGAPASTFAVEETRNSGQIYVLSNGWHSSVAVPRNAIPAGAWPILRDFPRAKYFVVGWGSDTFYRADKITPYVFCRTVFLPTPGALHVIGINSTPESAFRHSDIVRIETTRPKMERVARIVGESFKTDSRGGAIRLGNGFYDTSAFYAAKGWFYLPNTCNAWAAKLMRAAGCRINPPFAIGPGHLMKRAQRSGTKINSRRNPVDPL